jgi:RNA polymerase sigma-70 factor (ECF subfamily)
MKPEITAFQKGDTQHDQLRMYWSSMCQGDQHAFEKFYQSTFDRLYQYGMKLANEALVEDCLQELFLDLWRQREKLTHVDNPLAYLFRSLRNRLINQFRKNRKQQILSLQESPQFMYELNPLAEEEDQYLKEKLELALKKLSSQQREVIYLLYFNGMKAEEVAEILNVSLRTVYNTSYNAIRKLRSELDGNFENLNTFIILTLFCYFYI